MTELALPFVLAFAVALAGTLGCEAIARRAGLVKPPREDRWHRRPVPLLGGVAILAGVIVPVLVTPGAVSRFGPFLLVALAMGAVGLLDDLRPLPVSARLIAQIVLAAILVQFGFLLRLTPYPEFNVVLTLFWVVGITNAVNLLDNMDGLAAGMAVIVAAFRLAFFLMDGDRGGAVLSAIAAGALLGFLARNFPPAKIFMGDAGSLFVGFFLSGLCLVGDYAYTRGVTAVVVLPVMLMLIPIFDTTFVTLTRLLTGRPVSRGGRDHTSHRLVALGISERQALAFLYTISVLSGLLAILSYRYGLTYTIVLLALLLLGLFLLGVYLSQVQVLGGAPGERKRAIVHLVVDFPFTRHVARVAVDLVLILVAYYTAYLLRFEGDVEGQRDIFLRTVGPVIMLQLLALELSGAYRGLWRYTSIPDLLRVVRGTTIGVGGAVLYFVFTTRFEGLSRAVFVLDWLLLVVLLLGTRASFRLLGELLRPSRAGFRRVLIYGAGDGGVLVLRELRNNTSLRREPVGFLDDDRSKVGTRIQEVPVLGGLERGEDLLTAHRIEEVIVASEKIAPERVRALETICAAHGVAVARGRVRLE